MGYGHARALSQRLRLFRATLELVEGETLDIGSRLMGGQVSPEEVVVLGWRQRRIAEILNMIEDELRGAAGTLQQAA